MSKAIYDGLEFALIIADNDAPIAIKSHNHRVFVGVKNEFHSLVYSAPWVGEDVNVVISGEVAKQLKRHFLDAKLEFTDQSLRAVHGDTTGTFTLLPRGSVKISTLLSKHVDSDPVTLNPSDFFHAISATAHASNSTKIGDVRFKGFHITYDDNQLEIMATDSSLMSICSVPATRESGEKFTVIGNQSLPLVANIFGKLEDMSISLGDGTMSFSGTGENGVSIDLVSSLIKGTPALYGNVLTRAEADNKFEYSMSKADLLTAASRLTFFTTEESRSRIDFKLTREACWLGADNSRGRGNSASKVVSVTDNPEEITLGINLGYLLSFLKAMKLDDITLLVSTGTKPLLFICGDIKEIITVFTS